MRELVGAGVLKKPREATFNLGPRRGIPKRRYCLLTGLGVIASREVVVFIVLLLTLNLLTTTIVAPPSNASK
jgi:hypothetical protein